MNWLSLLSLAGASIVQDRIRRAKQRAMWLVLALVTGAAALVTFLCALQIVLAEALGPLKADLLIGAVLLVLALCFLLTAKLVSSAGRATELPLAAPALRETTRALAKTRSTAVGRAPLIVGGAALIGGLIGRYIVR